MKKQTPQLKVSLAGKFVAFVCLALLAGRLPADTIRGDVDIDKHALAASVIDESSLTRLARYLSRPCKNDRDKARAIYRWVTDRIAYDAEAYFNGVHGDNTPEAVLKSRKAICGGYAALYVDLGKRMDLETEVVPGHARSSSYVAGQPLGNQNRHAWVAVRIDGRWQLVEPTWGAGFLDGKKFAKEFLDYYFLPAPDQLLFTHLPTNPTWQLIETPLSMEEFLRRPRVGRSLFELGVSSKTILSAYAEKDFPGIVKVFSHPSKATTIVEVPLKKKLVAGEEYEFTLKSDYVEMCVVNNKVFTKMKRNGNVFTVRVRPNEGSLRVSGMVRAEDRSYSSVLAYAVE